MFEFWNLLSNYHKSNLINVLNLRINLIGENAL